MTATTKPTPLPLRNDTILGVCEAIGQDFGFNPLWLRLAFIAPLFFQPVLTIGTYLLLGVVVAATRYFLPRAAVAAEAPHLVADNPPAATAAAKDDEQLQIAA